MTLNMGRAKISAHELRRCLKTVLSHVNANDVWRGETLDSYCQDMRNVRILKMLENAPCGGWELKCSLRYAIRKERALVTMASYNGF